MDFHLSLSNTLINRKSCRKFQPGVTIPETTLNLIRWAANRAPYASGGPRREYFFVTDVVQKNELYLACMEQKYVNDCSVAIVFCGTEPGKRLRQGFSKFVFDCTAACMCADLMAVSMGYSTVWIGNFLPERVKEILKTDLRPTIILLVGKKKPEPLLQPEDKDEKTSTVD